MLSLFLNSTHKITTVDQRIKDAWELEKFYKHKQYTDARSEKLRDGKSL